MSLRKEFTEKHSMSTSKWLLKYLRVNGVLDPKRIVLLRNT